MFMAIDIGKTKTIAIVLDFNLNIHCISCSGPADVSLKEEIVLKNIDKAVKTCLKKPCKSFKNIDLMVFSWAGLDTKSAYNKAQEYIIKLGYPLSKVVIVHDAETALYAVTLGKPGIAVIAGTGAIAYGLNKHGTTARSSGWGWLIGNEGGASWIALKALNAAARAYDGRGKATSLVERFKQYFNVEDLLDIIPIIYKSPFDVSKISSLALIVDEEAKRGDEVACEILKTAGEELALAAYSVAKKLGMVDQKVIVGCVGSVFRSSIVYESFITEVKKLLPRAVIRPPITGIKAVIGPIVIAMKRLGLKVNQDDIERIMKSLEKIECLYE